MSRRVAITDRARPYIYSLGHIPVTNSVNPARSIGTALFAGSWAIGQLWLFIVAPLIGGVLGGVIYRSISEQPSAPSAMPPAA